MEGKKSRRDVALNKVNLCRVLQSRMLVLILLSVNQSIHWGELSCITEAWAARWIVRLWGVESSMVCSHECRGSEARRGWQGSDFEGYKLGFLDERWWLLENLLCGG